jgi:uncharacterized protein YbbC (DUF1343 family)
MNRRIRDHEFFKKILLSSCPPAGLPRDLLRGAGPVHSRCMLKRVLFTALLLLAYSAKPPALLSRGESVVRPGIEVFLRDVPAALRGKRVGLITNNTGIDRSRTSDIDLIAAHKDVSLVALLAPEHGIRGDADAGVKVPDEKDPKTGIPIHSLYLSEDRGPTAAMLKDVEVLVYDLQEVGGAPGRTSRRWRWR